MGSWKLGQIAGIDIFLHWTLLLLVALIAFSAPAGGVLGQMTLVAALFGCVLLHELGHALTARLYGIRTHGITLLMIGGVANLERMPRRPLQELWIAIAGPAVNVMIASSLFLLMGPLENAVSTGLVSAAIVKGAQYLMLANIVLAVFNLLPAFPMDGGRVLRALLAMKWPYVDATRVAAAVGRVVAVGLGLTGLITGQLTLILIAGFVVVAGLAEARTVTWENQQRENSRRIFTRRSSPGQWRANGGDTGIVVWDEREKRYRVIGVL